MGSGPYWCHDCETEHFSKCPWDVVKDKDKKIERLRERIEELEKQNDERLKIWNKQHHITDEMIKTAVSLAIINRDQNENITGFVMLKIFGFELCGKCDGEGEIVPVNKSGFKCPKCNGVGAVKHE